VSKSRVLGDDVLAPDATSEKPVPLADPGADAAPLREEILAATGRVLDRGWYVLGEEVAGFEQRIASRLGVPGAVGVASGTDALVLALLALGIGAGDEVITVSHTAGPTVAAIRIVGAIPVLVDIELETYCLDPTTLEKAVGPRTKAIIAVHLYGHPAALDDICKFAAHRGIAVVEDCAQAQDSTTGGRTVGSIGDFGCFSFYPTKILGAIGDGGLVVARDPKHVERLRQLRAYGWTKSQFSELSDGRCSRLDELQAAILAVKLDHLDRQIEHRRTLAGAYRDAFAKLPLSCPVERPECRHVYCLYVVRCRERDALARHLESAGIMTGRHYPFPIHEQPGLSAKARIPRPLSITDRIKNEILTLPLYPSMPGAFQARVVDAVRSFFSAAQSA
jgi:dTDP-4-amino-4,6-dideoxygalactose transaminase